jgi:hypothetical protein
VFENRVLRGIFGHKGQEMIGSWGKLHNGGLHQILWGEEDQKKGQMGGTCSMYVRHDKSIQASYLGSPKRRYHLEYPSLEGRIILKLILEKSKVIMCTFGCREPLGSIKGKEYLYQLSEC